MQLAESAHDRLVRRGIVLDMEAGVFGFELVQCIGQLLLVAALGRVDRETEQRNRALQAREVEMILLVRVVQDGVEMDVVDTRYRQDVSGHTLGDLDLLGTVEAIQMVDLERLARVAM